MEITAAPDTLYTSSEMDRSVSSTRYGGGGPVIGITMSVHSSPGCRRTAPTRRVGATVSPASIVAGLGGVACAGVGGGAPVGGCAAIGGGGPAVGGAAAADGTGAAGSGCALAVRTCSSLLRTQASC